MRSGKRRKEAAAEASEFLESFQLDVDQLSTRTAEAENTDFGVDLSGDSYEAEEQASHDESQRLLDTILEDDKLTDELIDRLMKRYNSRD